MKSAKPLLALALAGLLSCGDSSSPGSGKHAPITGTLQLTVGADASLGPTFWAILRRDGADEFKVEKITPGTRRALAWREEVTQPRTWKLKFGPSRHPTYQLILVAGEQRPEAGMAALAGFHDPAKSAAIAYFAIQLDGERELKVELPKPAPLSVSVVDPSGAPLEGARVVGIATPRYLFLDGFDPERVDAMHTSWSFDFWNFDHVQHNKIAPERIRTAKTDAQGNCRLDGFIGWAGISERDERFAMPRSLLAMDDLRSARFCITKKPAGVRLSVEGLPGRDTSITERGLIVDGDWPLPEGFKPARWSERLPFLQGKSAEFFTPCREVRVRPMSRVHRVAEGEIVKEIAPGEDRKHAVKVEELPHRTIEGEAVFEPSDLLSREHCGIELYESGPAGRLIRAAGSLGGPGVPKSGRVPFAFHVTDEGPYTVVVRSGNYICTVVRDVKAPREELMIPLSLDKRNIPCPLIVRGKDGAEVAGAVIGAWPQRDLVNEFLSGSRPAGKPGLNTFVIHAEAGSAILRDVAVEQGRAPKLEATLTPGVTVAGRLVDAEGRPVAGQWVHLSWPGYFRMASAFRWLSDLTGDDGKFEIPRVPAGPWRLYLRGTGAPVGGELALPAEGGTWDAGDLKIQRSDR
ncbi:MAG: carboxypeptidase regulatory-like domain-containing protein [Planctomycetes bacterium]|nr:carboxypeptidase regulatory-like domain-containing protein [Planctomycetota bacterium]